MKRAVEGLSQQPTEVVVDGNKLPDWSYQSRAIVQGDAKVEEISAASILAKVTRDREMVEMDQIYPGYGFAKHKGYPTQAHVAALKVQGVCQIHRRSYAPVKAILSQPSLIE